MTNDNPIDFKILTELFRGTWLRKTVVLLVMAFPVVAANVADGIGAIHALLFVLGLCCALSVWKELEKRERELLWGFVVFALCAALSLFNTQNLHDGVSKLERYLYFISAIPIYLLFRRFGDSGAKALLVGCTLAGLVNGAIAWYVVGVLQQEGVNSVYGKIIFGDISMLVAAFLGAAAISLELSTRIRILVVSSALAALSAGILSNTRGAWILVPVFVIIVLWFVFFRWSTKKWLLSGVILFCIALAVVLGADRISKGLNSGISDVDRTLADPSQISSWGERLLMWRDSVTIWKESPVLGTGMGDFEFDRQRLKDSGQTVFPVTYDHAHSIYFDALATTGLLGLVAMLVFAFILPLRIFITERTITSLVFGRFIVLSGVVVILAFATFGLTQGWFSRSVVVRSYILTLLVLVAAKFAAVSPEKKLVQ